MRFTVEQLPPVAGWPNQRIRLYAEHDYGRVLVGVLSVAPDEVEDVTRMMTHGGAEMLPPRHAITEPIPVLDQWFPPRS